jgi:hypothetical protein
MAAQHLLEAPVPEMEMNHKSSASGEGAIVMLRIQDADRALRFNGALTFPR